MGSTSRRSLVITLLFAAAAPLCAQPRARTTSDNELFSIEIAAGRRRVYVGQRVRLTLQIRVRPGRWGDQTLDATAMFRRITPLNFGPFLVSRPERVWQQERTVDGVAELHYVYEWQTDFIAERPGPIPLGGIAATIEYPDGAAYRELSAQADSDSLEVLPVPGVGRPPGYAGAVGLFAIEVTADATDVRVGDPIELTIDVYGDGPVESLPPPMLDLNTPLVHDFRLPPGQLTGEYVDARRRFRAVVRARRSDVSEIPSIDYPYFDPDVERFVIARSDPIPISVEPAAATAPLPRHTPAPLSPDAISRGLPGIAGLHDIRRDENALLAVARPLPRSLVDALLFAPPAAFAVCWIVMTRVGRARDKAVSMTRPVLRRARQRITASADQHAVDQARQIGAALREYLAERLGLPPGRCTGPGACDLLRDRGIDAELVEQWEAVLKRCEELAYGGERTGKEGDLTRRALACIAALEREERRTV